MINLTEVAVSRVQLALNVPNIDEAVAFYAKLFATEPNKRKPGYANFAIADPPLKLVLFAGAGEPGSLNHIGVEVASTDEVMAAVTRAQAVDLPTQLQESTTCCFAVQDKVWIDGPDNSWEFYTVLADAPELACSVTSDGGCESEPVSIGAAPESSCC